MDCTQISFLIQHASFSCYFCIVTYPFAPSQQIYVIVRTRGACLRARNQPRIQYTCTHNLSYTHATHIKQPRIQAFTYRLTVKVLYSSHRCTVSYIPFTPPFELIRILTLAPSLSFSMTHTRITQLSYSFSRIRYSLADNLAELVNLVEENLVVRHNSDEEVEEVDRTRMIYAPKGASKLCEFVIIRKVCRYTFFSSRSLSRRSCVVFRVVPCGIRGGVNVAAYRGFTAAFVLPPSSLLLSLSSPPTATYSFSSTRTLRTYTHVHVHNHG